jgi:hypothetical protein
VNKIRALTPAFFERFFDSDMAAGAASLKTSFFWLVSFLAVPGIFMPVMMSFNWSLKARFSGFDALDIVVRTDKVLYMGYGACAVGVVTAMAWNALLLDRRDGLVLGPLPVSGRDVITSKMLALAGYALLLMLCIHAGSAIFFGIFLGQLRGWASMAGTTAAHFAAASLCGLFVFFSMVALQGVALFVLGGRRFLRVSPVLQVLSVSVVLVGFFSLPVITNAVRHTLAGGGERYAPWILNTPVLWFLGVYEVLLGHRDPVLVHLAETGMIALGAVILTAFIAFPLSYSRLMASSIEGTGTIARRGPLSAMVHIAAKLGSRRSQTRAVIEFFALSLMRCSRQRLSLVIAIGASIAWASAVIAVEFFEGIPSSAPAIVLGIPIASTMFLVGAIRTAASMPSELPPRWMFAAVSTSDNHARSAVTRVTFALAVALPAAVAVWPVSRLWGWTLAGNHLLICLPIGALLVELAFARSFGTPCTREWNPDGANLRAFWPVYLGGFFLFAIAAPLAALAGWAATSATAGAVLVTAIITRIISSRVPADPEPPLDEQPGVQLLDI